MGLLALPNVYCTPQNVMDYLGVEGTQLHLDDRLQSSGLTIQVTADANVNDTILLTTPIVKPMLKGNVLEFNGSGMPVTSEVTLATVARKGDVSLNVQPLTDAIPALASAIDAGVNLAMAWRLILECRYATATVKRYCCGRYNDSQLAQTWSVNDWTRKLAGYAICKRRMQPSPQGVNEDYQAVMNELRMVQCSAMNIEDIGTRTAGWPFLANNTVDISYNVAKTRSQPSISEGTPTYFGQYIDWDSAMIFEW